MNWPRSSGIILHPTSLPGPYGSGDLGKESLHFLDWLKAAGQSVWQMLPVVPVGYGNSPYSGLSAFATSPLLVSLDDLVEQGWLGGDELESASTLGFEATRVDYPRVAHFRNQRLRKAAEAFFSTGNSAQRSDFEGFCAEQKHWLDDYCLFAALDSHFDHLEWSHWDPPLALREPEALESARKDLSPALDFHRFVQWRFFRQWQELRRQAHARNIRLMGDLPIFVAYHSADVWARRELFHLDERGQATVVAGVPPDYFSETGQRWGNPLYNWELMADSGFAWWKARIRAALELFDLIRIDHFRAFASYWEIPAHENTAIHGTWRPGPADAFFSALRDEFGDLPIVAEDLGMITPDVIELRRRVGLPGMKVLHFAFGSGPDNPFLPHNHQHDAVVYTGTHDNDTTQSWYESLPLEQKGFLVRYTGHEPVDIPWELMRLASCSVANTAMFPLQDVLGQGSEGRMNTPGQAAGNWEWRFSWEQMPPEAAERLRDLSYVSGRVLQ